jgi:hypothetical protein
MLRLQIVDMKKEALHEQVESARASLFSYLVEQGAIEFTDRDMRTTPDQRLDVWLRGNIALTQRFIDTWAEAEADYELEI